MSVEEEGDDYEWEVPTKEGKVVDDGERTGGGSPSQDGAAAPETAASASREPPPPAPDSWTLVSSPVVGNTETDDGGDGGTGVGGSGDEPVATESVVAKMESLTRSDDPPVLRKVGAWFTKNRRVWLQCSCNRSSDHTGVVPGDMLFWATAGGTWKGGERAGPLLRGSTPIYTIQGVETYQIAARTADTRSAKRRACTFALLRHVAPGMPGWQTLDTHPLVFETDSLEERDEWISAFRLLLSEHQASSRRRSLLAHAAHAENRKLSGVQFASTVPEWIGGELPNTLFGALRQLLAGITLMKAKSWGVGASHALKRTVVWSSLSLDQLYWSANPAATGARADKSLVVRDLKRVSAPKAGGEEAVYGIELATSTTNLMLVCPSVKVQEWCLQAFRTLVAMSQDSTGLREAFLFELSKHDSVFFRPGIELPPDTDYGIHHKLSNIGDSSSSSADETE